MNESELEKLESLRQHGILSEEAYWDARSRLMNPPPTTLPPPAAFPDPAAFATQPGPYPNLVATPPVGVPRSGHRKPPRRRRRAWTISAALVLLCAGGGAAYWLFWPQESDARISGTVTLVDDATAAANCVGTGEDADLFGGASVRVTGPDGSTLGSSTLSTGTPSGGECTYEFEVGGVKADESSYTIAVGGQSPVTRTQAELNDTNWHVEINVGPPRTTVGGSLELFDSDTAFNFCIGTGGYDDIGPGTNVVVKDQDGRILGSGSLGAGKSHGWGCTYRFHVAEVREDQQQYTLEISHRGGITESVGELRGNGWRFSVTLGS